MQLGSLTIMNFSPILLYEHGRVPQETDTKVTLLSIATCWCDAFLETSSRIHCFRVRSRQLTRQVLVYPPHRNTLPVHGGGSIELNPKFPGAPAGHQDEATDIRRRSLIVCITRNSELVFMYFVNLVRITKVFFSFRDHGKMKALVAPFLAVS